MFASELRPLKQTTIPTIKDAGRLQGLQLRRLVCPFSLEQQVCLQTMIKKRYHPVISETTFPKETRSSMHCLPTSVACDHSLQSLTDPATSTEVTEIISNTTEIDMTMGSIYTASPAKFREDSKSGQKSNHQQQQHTLS